MRYITAEKLWENNACALQIRAFKRAFPKKDFPNGARITLANARRAVRFNLNLRWAAVKFLALRLTEIFVTGLIMLQGTTYKTVDLTNS